MEYENKKLKEFEDFIRFRKIAIIGLGVSNIPLIDYMHEKKAKVTVFDDREFEKIPEEITKKIENYKFEYSFGKDNLKKLKNFDIIFRSPSCLPTRTELVEEEKRGALVTTEIEMLMKMCPCKIVGVTGSDGKTTTTSLIYSILKEAGYNTYLGGNIGTPLFTKISEIKPDDIVVLELSSFQLMGMKVSPHIGVITNITPNHLNIHKDYQEYIDAKKNIFKYQKENDIKQLQNVLFHATDRSYQRQTRPTDDSSHAYPLLRSLHRTSFPNDYLQRESQSPDRTSTQLRRYTNRQSVITTVCDPLRHIHPP